MKPPRSFALFAVFGSIAGVQPALVHAAPLSSMDAAVIAQSTFMDSDLFLLGDFVGFQPGQSFTYSGMGDAVSWSATVTGAYLGIPLTATYAGNSSAFPGGPTTWTSAGTFGPQAWNSSGSALITSTATSFQVSFADALTVGPTQGSISAIIQGTIDPDSTLQYTTTSGTLSTPSFSGALPVNAYSYREGPRQDDQNFRPIETNDIFSGRGIWDDVSTLTFVENPPGEYLLRNAVSSVPEPSTLLLLGSGLMGLVAWRNRRGRPSQRRANIRPEHGGERRH